MKRTLESRLEAARARMAVRANRAQRAEAKAEAAEAQRRARLVEGIMANAQAYHAGKTQAYEADAVAEPIVFIGYVYAIRCQSGVVKIGFTEAMRTRFRGIASKWPGRLHIERCLSVLHCDMAKAEKFAHGILAHRRVNPAGEWFRADVNEVYQALNATRLEFEGAGWAKEFRNVSWVGTMKKHIAPSAAFVVRSRLCGVSASKIHDLATF